VEYSEGLQVGYRWYDAQGIEPLFPFGHGLTYTTFAYDQLQVTPTMTRDGDKTLRIRFRVTNTGDTTATETAQAYVELPGVAGEPSKRLLGWDQVTLGPGEREKVQIALSGEDLEDLHLLEYWDTASQDWTTPTGTYTVTVGGSFETETQDAVRMR
jgi:beta-glucosidase